MNKKKHGKNKKRKKIDSTGRAASEMQDGKSCKKAGLCKRVKGFLKLVMGLVMSRSMILAVISGLLTAAAFFPFGLSFLIFFSLVPLLYAVHGSEPGQGLGLKEVQGSGLRRGKRQGSGFPRGGFYGGVTGIVCYGVSFHWILPLIEHFSNLSWSFAFCGFVLWLLCASIFWIIIGAVWGLRKQLPCWGFVMVAVPVIVEFLWPRIFPWYFGAPVIEMPALVQIADLGGVSSVSLLVITVNYALFCLWNFFRGKISFPVLPVASAVLLLGGSGIYGLLKLDAGRNPGKMLNVLLINPSIQIDEKNKAMGDIKLYLEQQKKLFYQGINALKDRKKVDLVLYPEALFEAGLVEQFGLFKRLGVPVFYGADFYDKEKGKMFNAAILDQGGKQQHYFKHKLVPFGEYFPLSETFPWIEKFIGLGSLGRGKGAECMKLGDSTLIAPLICYEVIVPGYVRQFVKQGAEVLVNITEDGWYGRTGEPYQHLLLARMRAVENHRYLIRCVNNGISAIIDPLGRIEKYKLDYDHCSIISSRVGLYSDLTFYSKNGSWLVYLFMLSMIIYFVFVCWQSRKRE